MDIERRTITMTALKVLQKTENETEKRSIEGHAAVFNEWSEPLADFFFPYNERVLPGAFTDTIRKDDIRALFNHDPNYVLGRNRSNTLFLEEDEKGLKVLIMPPDTQWARDLTVSIERGDINQMSFGFVVLDDKWRTEDGKDVRELLKVQLLDVSPVTFPAYSQTDVGIRSINYVYNRHKTATIEELKQLELGKQKFEIYKRKFELLSKQ